MTQAPAHNVAIELRCLAIGYGLGRDKSSVAEALSAQFEAGKLTCLLGNNGVGKSTLLRTIAGLQRPLGGSVTIDIGSGRKNVAEMSRHELAMAEGVVLTDRPYAINLTVKELVAMGRTPHTGLLGRLSEADREAVNHAIEVTGIGGFAMKKVKNLSDGMLQKAMIAKTLAAQTPIILLDEPTAYLDFAAKADVMRLLWKLAHDENKTVLATTHDLQLALWYSDDVAVMSGDGVEVGSPHDMAHRMALQSLVSQAGARLNPATLAIELVAPNA